jgi:hypothetical protein
MHARQIGPLNLGDKPYARKKSQIVFVGAGYRVRHGIRQEARQGTSLCGGHAGARCVRSWLVRAECIPGRWHGRVKSGRSVVLDACVLIPMPLADTLLRLAADSRLFMPK